MNPVFSGEQDNVGLEQDFATSSQYLSQALEEVAAELGEQGLAAKATESSDTTWPEPAVLKFLDDLYPGAAEQVLKRSEIIQEETHKREIAELNKMKIRMCGRRILKGLANFNN